MLSTALPPPSSITVMEITQSSIQIKWAMDPRGRMKTKGTFQTQIEYYILYIINIYVIFSISPFLS